MVTKPVRAIVWLDMLDVSRVTRYAEAMSTRYRVRHLVLRTILFVAASGSVATAVTTLPDFWRAVCGIAIAVIVVADYMLDYATKIAALDSAKRECQALESDWRELWLDVDLPASHDADIRFRNVQLIRRFERVTVPMDTQVPVNQKVNVRSAESAYQVAGNQHASS